MAATLRLNKPSRIASASEVRKTARQCAAVCALRPLDRTEVIILPTSAGWS
jgi:hypothetical protein